MNIDNTNNATAIEAAKARYAAASAARNKFLDEWHTLPELAELNERKKELVQLCKELGYTGPEYEAASAEYEAIVATRWEEWEPILVEVCDAYNHLEDLLEEE